MAVFSVNQATQMMVDADKRTIGNNDYYVAAGCPTIVIPQDSIIYTSEPQAVSTLSDNMCVNTITVPSNVKEGAEYIVRLHVTTDYGVAAADIKTVGVVATKGTKTTVAEGTADVIRTLLNKALKRDIEKDFTVTGTGAEVIITPEIHWTLGKRSVIPTIVVEIVGISQDVDGMDLSSWVRTTYVSADNGVDKIKDLEWFCAGERGDQYRGVSYPNDIPFVSKLDDLTGDSTVQIIHYAITGSNEAVQKSEQTLVLVSM